MKKLSPAPPKNTQDLLTQLGLISVSKFLAEDAIAIIQNDHDKNQVDDNGQNGRNRRNGSTLEPDIIHRRQW